MQTPAIPATATPARMPAGIPYIVVNESAERFSFYGINAILAVFLVEYLHFGEAQATTWGALFKSGAYFFPLLGAIVSDVFWGKYRTVLVFSGVYALGCTVLALGHGAQQLALGLFLVAFGTGGIKPCVATNVGDQFTAANRHLIERAFSLFYLGINSGSIISTLACPWLLPRFGPLVAFGLPAVMMVFATIVFWAGRRRFAVVPPAGAAWLREVTGPVGLRTLANLAVIYLFIAFFWALWDQSNGTSWSLQARSPLLDKHLGFGITLLPAQVQAVNPLLILLATPFFSFVVYPLWGRVTHVTPLRKIGLGLFITASSFVVIAWIEAQIQAGHVVSVWWQILAYLILTCGEVLVSITGLEFSYTQAPLTMKSFVMALFYLSISLGNLFTAGVNHFMVKPLAASAIETGSETWVHLTDAARFVPGQKIDFGGDTGVYVIKSQAGATGQGGTAAPSRAALAGTWLVDRVDAGQSRVRLLDPETRLPVRSTGDYTATSARISTYSLVGPRYFLFFAALMAAAAFVFVLVALLYRERSYVRDAVGGPAAAPAGGA